MIILAYRVLGRKRKLTMRKKILLIIFCLCAFLIRAANADVMHFERGGASTVPGLVEKGQINYEGGLFNYADEFNGEGSWGLALGSSKIRYGLLKRFELRALNSGVLVNDKLAGFDNLGLGFKLALLEEEHGLLPTLNLITDFQIPIGREELRNTGFNHSYLFTMSHSLIGKLGFVGNIGAAFSSNPSNFGGDFTGVEIPYVANLNYAVNDKLGLFTDIYGVWGLTDGFANPVSQDFGFAYAITDNFIYDLSLNWGLNESAPDFGIDTGIAIRLR